MELFQPARLTCTQGGFLTLNSHCLSQVFHYLSLSILTIFLVEVGFKVFIYRWEFFHHKFEVLDGIVVIVSFILDVILIFREHEFEAVGLLILLRLWRVARIINGRCARPVGSFPLSVDLPTFPELSGMASLFPSQSHLQDTRVLLSQQDLLTLLL